ncbi:bile acid:sodium symporter family protein [Novosphingobium album (ex Liu et al. 2023)]|uniref:Bile acid:sodium symporter n=1 Tax=Novosphingobium album (ex Liu et al. 2023) TaxID=3031130 RepID=A0ABT5WP28_9SPHN|nr:bile acid:sodium symporter family protein [Novosphingobium album (ex Liu et al. 2023)]MDE8651027.1 bile acid:sodium symporter [Novosphingobium album (ex Liu et al. 2023)]
MTRLFARIDPLVRLILGAILLATLLPATGGAYVLAQAISTVAIFVLFLFYGMRLSRREVWEGLGNHRLLVPLVIWVFGVMALAGWAVWRAAEPVVPASLALGFLYLGVLPSTVQSATVYCSLARGNVASSVVAAALLNILAVFLTVPLYSLLAGSEAQVFDGTTLVKVLTMLLLPFLIGQGLQTVTHEWVMHHRAAIAMMDRGVIALGVYVAFSGAVGDGIWSRMDPVAWLAVLLGCGLLLAFAYGGAWLLGGALRLSRGDRISLLFAGGQKSIAMGAPLATLLFPPATAGTVLLPLLVYHLSQMVAAAPIAGRLARGAQGEAVRA